MSAWMMRAMCSLTSCVPLLSFATISETVPAASNSAGVTRFMCTMALCAPRSASQPVPAKTSPGFGFGGLRAAQSGAVYRYKAQRELTPD